MAFLHEYNLNKDFMLNIEPNHTTLAGHASEHDVVVASAYGMLGSVDSNTGDPVLGWDTDNFPMNLEETTAIMSVIVKQGGLATGGLNFDCKVRRESVDPVDLFIGHIGAMDCYALGLRKAAAIQTGGELDLMLTERYESWEKEELGRKIRDGRATLEECEAFAKGRGQPHLKSGKQELYEMIRNRYLYPGN